MHAFVLCYRSLLAGFLFPPELVEQDRFLLARAARERAIPDAAATSAPAPASGASARLPRGRPTAVPPAPLVPRTPPAACSAGSRASRRRRNPPRSTAHRSARRATAAPIASISNSAGSSPPETTKSPIESSRSTGALEQPLIDALVAPGNDNQPRLRRQLDDSPVPQRLALRRQCKHPRRRHALARQPLARRADRLFQRLGQHDHARPAAVRPIVDAAYDDPWRNRADSSVPSVHNARSRAAPGHPIRRGTLPPAQETA